jgi:hypothetical protein
MNENDQIPESGTIIKAAATDCDMATAWLEIDPRELAIIVRRRIVALKFPTPEREREAAGCMRSRSKHIDGLIHDGAPLMKIYAELGTMEELCQNLTAPLPIPSFQDQIASAMHTFLNLGWATGEVEALRPFHKHGDCISDIAISGVKMGDRQITRTELHEDMRNRGWSNASLHGYAQNQKTATRNELYREEIRENGGRVKLIFSDGPTNQKAVQN